MNGLLRQSQLFIKRHGSTILTVAGGVGVIATTITAVKATPKALTLIEEAKEKKGEELTKWEIVNTTGITYLPTIVLATTTLACIISANYLNQKKQASLIAAYGLLDQSFKRYKNKLIELYGEETHNEVVQAIMVEEAKEVGISASNFATNCILTGEDTCGEPVLFYDEWSNRYFETTIEQVITAEYHLNRNFVLRGGCLLNEFYDFLGLDNTEVGGTIGWTVEDELYWIDFNHRKVYMDDGLECYIIESPWGPTAEGMDYGYW